MAVLSYREVLPRTFQHRFGESPTAEMKFVVTVDEPTPTQQVIGAVGYVHGASHPEYPYLLMLDGSVTESDRFHAEVTLRFEVPKQEEFDPNPLARPDVWSFSTGGAQVPALTCYDGNTQKPLVNSAKTYFPGLTTLEAEVRATVAWNRAVFPASVAAAVTNCVNSEAYLWGGPHTWLCAGISAQQTTEVVNDVEVRYWQGTSELVYRASSHDLYLPNVGFEYLEDGELKQAWVKDRNGQEVPSALPRALNPDGSLKAAGQEPDILVRQMYREVNFSSYFGTPPF
jgi:hypothetical protein